MKFRKMVVLCLCVAFSKCASSTVFVRWSDAKVPPASSLGVGDIVFAWEPGAAPARLAIARKQGYRAYVETRLEQAPVAAKACAEALCTGIILDGTESVETEKSLAGLRSTYPKLRFLALNANGKQPQMRGSLVIKRDSVLEVSSPTMQPWIDTNLALIRVEQRSRQQQVPLYSFAWNDEAQHRTLTADDYSLALAEAGSFHADFVLPMDDDLQRALSRQDSQAWALWNQVRAFLKFSNDARVGSWEPAANVAVVVDQPDFSDEVLNLLSRHNIPFQVFLAADLKTAELKGFDIVIVFAKADAESAERINRLATAGSIIVIVDAHGRYPWQSTPAVSVNQHTTSYVVGSGRVLELAEPVSDPETFAQDIRRLLGKNNSLLSLWNGLTTIAVPYRNHDGAMTLLEFMNYAGEPVRLQVQVKGSFANVRYETPEHGCCTSLAPVEHNGFTEFVIPELRITGRIHLDAR